MMRFAAKLAAAMLALTLAACATTPGGSIGGSSPAADRPISDLTPATAAEARAKAHVELGMAYLQLGRFDIALDEAQIALQDDASYAPAFHLRGLVFMFVEDFAKAEESLSRALRQAPGDPEFNNSYGWFLCLRGREAEGLERLALAARNPYYRVPTRPHTNAGLCHLRKGDQAAAEQAFLRAVDADPSNVQALFELAAIAYRKGDYGSARIYLVRLHQQSEPTPETVWLGLRTERRLGNHDAEASYAAQLRSRFADSPQYGLMQQGRFE
ncbi:type IV pilus biogenesis/stability protein PilW [Pseudothauera nasutitermitis]|uniref:Type IV pilus biogenesis/stability protein PilW n=1 Tax=Pseudothauera nasutitermitis TaxID=2565930 RepID=A0A4S4AQ26_9RHOO|nr:type IV pilus biogenesis/stability protein PilW [Pseudothauera nasutitermitis]THF61827.1 type IV pilus biogenesis/stability protein PilW [Pseudothauera nasutitermitis]